MRCLFVAFLVACVAGCARDRISPPEQRSDSSTPEVPVRLDVEESPRPQIKIDPTSNLDALSVDMHRALRVAKAHLEKQIFEDDEAVFSVTEKPDGYGVFLQHISGRHEDGTPVFFPGGHCMVIVSPDFKVVRVVGGA